jgi:hypothetical protein
MPLRGWLRRLEDRASEGQSSFELASGGRYHYDFDQAGLEVFAHAVTLQVLEAGEEEPEPPEIVRMIREARDPEEAMRPFECAFIDASGMLRKASQTHVD